MDKELKEIIDEYEEDIESTESDLKYFKQLANSYDKFRQKQWVQALASVDLGFDLGDKVNFESIKTALQLCSIVEPEMLSKEAINKQLEDLKVFFEGEKKRLDNLFENINLMINSINEMDYEPPSQDEFDLALNEYINSNVYESGINIERIASKLSPDNVEVSKQELKNIVSKLDTGDISLVQQIELLGILWNNISDSFNRMTLPNSPDYERFSDTFQMVWDNLKNTYGAYGAVHAEVRLISSLLRDFNDVLLEDWGSTINHIISNLDLDANTGLTSRGNLEKFQGGQEIKLAIEKFIATKTPQNVEVSPPLISSLITEDILKTWRVRSNIVKFNNKSWTKSIEKIISRLDKLIGSDQYVFYEDLEKNFLGPIIEGIIRMYQDTSSPYWNWLERNVREVEFVLQNLQRGVVVSYDISTKLNEIKSRVESIANILDNISFDGLSVTTGASAFVNGILSLGDDLGIGHLTNNILLGDFASIWNMSEEKAKGFSEGLDFLRESGLDDEITRKVIEVKTYLDGKRRRQEGMEVDFEIAEERKEKELENKKSNLREIKGGLS